MQFIFLFSILICFSAVTSQTFAQTTSEKDMQAALKKYETDVKKAKLRMVDAFDRYKKVVKQTSPNPEALASALIAIDDSRTAFLQSNVIPKDEIYNEALFEYAALLHQAQLPLQRAYNSAYQKAIKNNDTDTLRYLTSEKAKLDQVLNAREQFKPNTRWSGFRIQTTKVLIDPKKPLKGFKLTQGQISVRLTVNSIEANAFTGNLEQNIQFRDHAEFKTSGQMEGTMIKWWIETAINTAMRRHEYTGYVIGDRIMGKVQGWTPNGEPLTAWFRLTRN